jgi:RNA polymerase sigma factor (sigma-70 family)
LDIVMYCQTDGDERLACAQAGCEDCLKALLLENENLIWAVTCAQRFGLAEYVELREEGRIGFWLAVKHYDPNRGVRFSTFAWQIIRRRIWNLVARVSKDDGYLTTENNADLGQQVLEAWQAEQVREALGAELANLPEPHRQIVEAHSGWNGHPPQTFAEIGGTRGVSRQRIHQIYQQALLLLRTPGLSIRLRSLCEHDSREHYRQALQINHKWQRSYGRRK